MLACREGGNRDGGGLQWQQEPEAACPHFGCSLSTVRTRSWDWIFNLQGDPPTTHFFRLGPNPIGPIISQSGATIWGPSVQTHEPIGTFHINHSRQTAASSRTRDKSGRGDRSHGIRWQNSSANVNLVPPSCLLSLLSTCGLFGPEHSPRDRE